MQNSTILLQTWNSTYNETKMYSVQELNFKFEGYNNFKHCISDTAAYKGALHTRKMWNIADLINMYMA